MATKSASLHYSTQNDMLAAKKYMEENGTLAGFESPSGNYDWENWSRVPAAAAYAGSDGIFDPEEEQRLLDASLAVWGGKPKEVSDLTRAGQGVVRIAKIIPGPHQAALNVADQLMKGKLSGHEISKNPFVRAMAGAAGGAAGSALGTSQSTSMGNAIKSGARMELQDWAGLEPYARQGLNQIKNGWNPYKEPTAVPGGATGAQPTNMDDYWKGIGEAAQKPGATFDGIMQPNNMEDYWQGIGEAASKPGASFDGIMEGGSGIKGGQVRPTSTGGGGVSGGGGNNLMQMAMLGMLGDALKQDNKANVPPVGATPYAQGGGLPTYGDLGLITNQQALEDQRRRLAAKKVA